MLSCDLVLNIYLGQQGGRVEGMPYDSKIWRCWEKRMKTQYRNWGRIDVTGRRIFNAVAEDWKCYNAKGFYHVTLLMSISPHYCML